MLTTKPTRQRKQVNLEIAPGLRRSVRAEARRQGLTFSDFVRKALREALDAARSAEQQSRAAPAA